MSLDPSKDEASVKGVVFDRKTGEPISQVNILINSTKGSTTDSEGKFNIELTEGKHKIKADMVGYTTLVTRKIRLRRGEEVEIEIYLGTYQIF